MNKKEYNNINPEMCEYIRKHGRSIVELLSEDPIIELGRLQPVMIDNMNNGYYVYFVLGNGHDSFTSLNPILHPNIKDGKIEFKVPYKILMNKIECKKEETNMTSDEVMKKYSSSMINLLKRAKWLNELHEENPILEFGYIQPVIINMTYAGDESENYYTVHFIMGDGKHSLSSLPYMIKLDERGAIKVISIDIPCMDLDRWKTINKKERFTTLEDLLLMMSNDPHSSKFAFFMVRTNNSTFPGKFKYEAEASCTVFAEMYKDKTTGNELLCKKVKEIKMVPINPNDNIIGFSQSKGYIAEKIDGNDLKNQYFAQCILEIWLEE